MAACPFSEDCLNKGWRCQFCRIPLGIFRGFKDREYYRKILPLIPDLKSLFDVQKGESW
jgi:hypothetical protein